MRKKPRQGNDRAYWAKVRNDVLPGFQYTPGTVVGVYGTGVGPATTDALLIAVVASEPDTLGVCPAHKADEIFIPLVVVGECPVKVPDVCVGQFFLEKDSNLFVGVDSSGQLKFFRPSDPRSRSWTDIKVFGMALRSHTLFTEHGELEPFQGVKGIVVQISCQAVDAFNARRAEHWVCICACMYACIHACVCKFALYL